jgi:hypothetical protein
MSDKVVTKVCLMCRKSKGLTEFHRSRTTWQSYCKACQIERAREWYRKNRERALATQKRTRSRLSAEQRRDRRHKRFTSQLKTKYNLTRESFDELLQRTQGRCEICNAELSRSREPHIDHDHESGRVRGLLCAFCNPRLPLIERLGHGGFFRALAYLLRADL